MLGASGLFASTYDSFWGLSTVPGNKGASEFVFHCFTSQFIHATGVQDLPRGRQNSMNVSRLWRVEAAGEGLRSVTRLEGCVGHLKSKGNVAS